ncbi:hypothetical protein V6N13_083537 [Hibiscus sabdariffa]
MMSTKLESKSQKCTFVGYPKETKGYYFYNENKVFVARTEVFLEKEFLSNKGKDQDEPKTYQEAVASPDFEKWLEAMRSEMDFMSENQVWTLVEPPEGVKPKGCKWVFKKKTDMDGNVQTYKGRLVAKASFHDYEIWQMDVKTAFLNGKLEEDAYMTRPEGFVTLENAGKANPGEGHWTTVKNILKYLRRTKDVFLVYRGEEELGIKGYTDASFQTDKNDSQSQSGFVFCLNGGTVRWKSSKQNTVTDSTTKAEYVTASEATKETVWIKEFISELRVIISIADAAIAQVKEPRSHHRPKHTFKCFYLI